MLREISFWIKKINSLISWESNKTIHETWFIQLKKSLKSIKLIGSIVIIITIIIITHFPAFHIALLFIR